VDFFPLIESTLNNPIIPYEPSKHSLKAWAMFCLRDRGFKVVYAQNADFATESRAQGKVYFSVTTDPAISPSPGVAWIVMHNGQVQVLPPVS
jgi:hypothetical protein